MLPIRSCPAAAVAVATSLLVAACGGSDSTTTTIAADDDHVMETAFGEPAAPGEADRTIEIVASDDFRFTPDTVTVPVGETVTFRIVNSGQILHDFTLGDQATQDEHEEEMAEMGGMTMPDEPNAVAIAAGETKDLTRRFTEEGTVLIGCHEPGHYAAGMKGQITVKT